MIVIIGFCILIVLTFSFYLYYSCYYTTVIDVKKLNNKFEINDGKNKSSTTCTEEIPVVNVMNDNLPSSKPTKQRKNKKSKKKKSKKRKWEDVSQHIHDDSISNLIC